jgi:asparagine synthase (glutamine-hydrolysing)
MCGIAGAVIPRGRSAEELERIARGMATALRHRGPDDAGTWLDEAAGVAFAHRRLAIVDLSPTGHQPMASASGRFVVVFNGEIYNFRDLRQELETTGAAFRGTSDTEVLLAGMDRWGVRGTIERSVGMFAIAVWDRAERTLTLVRDRLGEKPLLVARMPYGLAFASELRAFEALPGWSWDVDPDAVAGLLRFGYIPEQFAIDRKVHRVLPGHLHVIRLDGGGALAEAAEPYWDVQDAIAETKVPDAPEAAVDELERLLIQSLQGQRIADVPLGSFLSGGIDSSTVTAVLQKVSPAPVRTFSIGFEEAEYDESGFARAVADHIGCAHTEFRVSATEALRTIDQLADIYDEPFADPSQVPTFLVSRLARQAVTVCLSGDGGDELFGGYNRYFWTHRWGGKLLMLPRPVRSAMGQAAGWAVQAMPDDVVRRLVGGRVGAGGAPLQNPRGKLHKAIAMLQIDDPVTRYSQLTACVSDPAALIEPEVRDHSPDADLRAMTGRWGELFGSMMWDIVGYLPGDQLMRVDRASMAVSLEMRAPLLDHRVAAFAVAATRAFGERKVSAQPKWLLREVLYRHVPRELVERPKMGFSIPLARWLRVELRDWAEALLAPSALAAHGLFRPAAVRALWTEHLDGHADHNRALWSVLMFQQWHEAARSRRASEAGVLS